MWPSTSIPATLASVVDSVSTLQHFPQKWLVLASVSLGSPLCAVNWIANPLFQLWSLIRPSRNTTVHAPPTPSPKIQDSGWVSRITLEQAYIWAICSSSVEPSVLRHNISSSIEDWLTDPQSSMPTVTSTGAGPHAMPWYRSFTWAWFLASLATLPTSTRYGMLNCGWIAICGATPRKSTR